MNPTPAAARALQDQAMARWRHALRTPLNALLAAAQVLETVPPHSAVAAEARRIVARQARQLAWVISALPGEGEDEGPGD